ncbi:MAG: triose-phosphate isomerase [Candidatus Aenigmarchaeota archaeon]|nr:triose-phosphate isomerase [Candidatus Aenigmarchaeota archaeon]
MPIFVINFKLYEEILGEKGRKIAEAAKRIASRSGVNIVIAPPAADIRLLSGIMPVVAQHIDPVESGAQTGHITAESVKAAGAIGTLINHSEKPMDIGDVEKCVLRAKQNKLITICCADSPENAALFAKLDPDYVLIEPPELIGGKNSVSKTKPEVISSAVGLVRSANPNVGLICGAGVSTSEDAAIAKKLGAVGVAAASAIAKSANPERVIEEISNGLI